MGECRCSREYSMDGRLSMWAGKAYPRPFKSTEVSFQNSLWWCFRAGFRVSRVLFLGSFRNLPRPMI